MRFEGWMQEKDYSNIIYENMNKYASLYNLNYLKQVANKIRFIDF